MGVDQSDCGGPNQPCETIGYSLYTLRNDSFSDFITNGTFYLLPGNYSTDQNTNLTLPNNATFIGIGNSKSAKKNRKKKINYFFLDAIIDFDYSSGDGFVVPYANEVNFINITFSNFNRTIINVKSETRNGTIAFFNCIFSSDKIQQIDHSTSIILFKESLTMNIRVTNCTFYSNDFVSLRGTGLLEIFNSTFYSNRQTILDVISATILIQNSIFHNNSDGFPLPSSLLSPFPTPSPFPASSNSHMGGL